MLTDALAVAFSIACGLTAALVSAASIGEVLKYGKPSQAVPSLVWCFAGVLQFFTLAIKTMLMTTEASPCEPYAWGTLPVSGLFAAASFTGMVTIALKDALAVKRADT